MGSGSRISVLGPISTEQGQDTLASVLVGVDGEKWFVVGEHEKECGVDGAGVVVVGFLEEEGGRVDVRDVCLEGVEFIVGLCGIGVNF